jgi:subtilisin family serine protease
MSRARRGLAVGAAALALGVVATTLSSAGAATQEKSTPVPIATPEGQVSAYVVNAKKATASGTADARRVVREAGGTVVQQWPQIGVVVAHSTHADFRADVYRLGRKSVASVGATRTVAVSEKAPQASALRRSAETKELTGEFANTPERDVVPDPREAEQWDMKHIKADRAHRITDGSRRTLVGVLDSGIDADHPDLAANIDVRNSVNCTDGGTIDRSATGWQPTTSDHGTHVAGTIGAARNGVGITGVAPNVRMASVKVVNDDGFIYPEYAVCGFMWAGMKGMDVTNNSYYVDPFEFWCQDQPDQAAALESVRRAVRWSTKQGTLHVAAAGNSAYDLANKTTNASSPNDGEPVQRTINKNCLDIPTELPGVVTVSSYAQIGTTDQTQLSSFSNRGLGVIDVAAPGSRILSTVVKDNGYGLKSGTSMASPHVAGVAALLVSKHPSWSPARLTKALEQQADERPCAVQQPSTSPGALCTGTPRLNSYAGHGMVDALDAVRR